MIKVLVPNMPTADQLLPWLRRIDEARWYVKGGPLVRQLEQRIYSIVKQPCVAVGNGTVALELALRAMDLPRGSCVLVPSLTFVASGQAIINAGLWPVLCDVDQHTLQLDATTALSICRREPQIRAVMPVATFGQAVQVEPWERFTYETNLPVLIDAAGAIFDQQPSVIPEITISYSLNATKALGSGEGGIVASGDLLLLQRVAELSNFGGAGTNARMSEYHAAVGLACMECVEHAWRGPVFSRYAQDLPDTARILGGAQSHRTLLCVELPEYPNAEHVAGFLAEQLIETKQWYRPFLDERPDFAICVVDGPLAATNRVKQRVLGLPFHAFLELEHVEAVCQALSRALA